MKTFTIDAENNVTVHASKKAAKEIGIPTFASSEEFAEIIGTDNERLVEIFNSLPGIKPITKFANRKAGTQRIWNAIQTLGETAPVASAETATEAEATEAKPQPTAEQPVAAEAPAAATTVEVPAEHESTPTEPLADAGAEAADVAPEQPAAEKGATSAKKARKAKKAPNSKADADGTTEATGPREGTKAAQVVALLQREQGATIGEIMSSMGWQKHTVRGFMAGAVKKAGYTVKSFKPEGGERTYRINK